MKRFLLFCLISWASLAQTVTSTTVPVNTNMVLQGRGTLFFNANSNLLFQTTDPRYVNRNGTNEFSTLFARWAQAYEIYEPTVTRSFIIDTSTSTYQYNHDSSIAYWNGLYYAVWNANTNPLEDRVGQVNLLSTSSDLVTWSAPFAPFNSSAYSTNPVTYNPLTDRQWQPNLLVVGTELWCVWMQQLPASPSFVGYRPYFSKLTSPSGKWTNLELTDNLNINGTEYYAFPTQNPIQLQSGRVLAPVTWISTNFVYTTGWPTNTPVFSNEKRSGLFLTDDLGATWTVGGYTTFPGQSSYDWEPVLWEDNDRSLRMFTRNFNLRDFAPSRGYGTAVGTAGGESFGPLEYVRSEVASSRMGLIKQAGTSFRHIGLQNDWRPLGSSTADRYNLALFSSRSGRGDLVPGIGWTTNETVVSYPQGIIQSNKIVITYSQGQEPRNLKLAVIDPAPDLNKWYLLPRYNDKVNPLVEWTNSPTQQFVYGSSSSMRAVTGTTGWGTQTTVSIGAWLNKSTAFNNAIWDNRDLGNGYGVAFAVVNSKLRIVLYNSGSIVASNYDFSSLNVPTGQWFYAGVSIDGGGSSATAYLVDAAGTATTQTVAVAAYNQLGAGTAYFGGPTSGSGLGTISGSIRHILVQQGVVWSANNHRYFHGIDQAALGATDWAGTETNPGGTIDYDYWAANANAGSNNAAWLADWDPTGSTFRGDSYSGTVDGKVSLIVTGTGSAGVEVPLIAKDNQFVFGTTFQMATPTSASDRVIVTVGDAVSKFMVMTRAATPTVLELYSQQLSKYYTIATGLADSTWIPLQVKIGGGTISVSVDNAQTVQLPLTMEQPFVFLGQGYLQSASIVPSNQISFWLEKTGFNLEPVSRLYDSSAYNVLSTNIVSAGTIPRITLEDTDGGVSNFFYAIDNVVRLSSTNNSVSADTTFFWDVINGEFISQGAVPRIQLKGFVSDPVLRGVGGGGTRASPTNTSSGQLLLGLRGAGRDDSDTGTAAEIKMTAVETFTTNAHGTEIVISTTPSGSTTLTPVFAIRNTGAIQGTGDLSFTNTAPQWNLAAANGSSGARLNAIGTSSQAWRLQAEGVTVLTINADGTAFLSGNRLQLGGSGGPGWYYGSVNPEGVRSATPGSYYSLTNDPASLYFKVTGTGNTGWTNVVIP